MCITEYNEAETMQMFREEGLEEGLEKGLEKGREEGENRFGGLMEQLLSSGRINDAQKAATDKGAREALYKEFGI